MLPVVSNDALDKVAYFMESQYQLPFILFAESLGQEIFNQVKKDGILKGKKEILILVEPNDKGVYALALARKLYLSGKKVRVCGINFESSATKNFLENKKILLSMANIYQENIRIDELKALVDQSDLLIEALWQPNHCNLSQDIIDIIDKHPFKISIDLPLGLSNDTKQKSFTTNITYALLAPKILFYENNNEKYLGSLKIIHLDLPKSLVDYLKVNTYLITKKELDENLPVRYENGHKGTYGTLGFISSQESMLGSSILFANAALVSGIGKLYVYANEKMRASYLKVLPEVIIEKKDNLWESVNSFKALACGFGLGISEENLKLIKDILQITNIPLLLDADAINLIAQYDIDLSLYKGKNLVMTPHPKEFARLLQCSVKEVLANRVELARNFAIEKNVVLVLKGKNTLIANPSGQIYINTIDDSSLSRAGSGDILSGIIATFLAQGLSAEYAAVVGVTLHGLCGKIAHKNYGAYSVTSGRIISTIEKYLKEIGRKGKRLYL